MNIANIARRAGAGSLVLGTLVLAGPAPASAAGHHCKRVHTNRYYDGYKVTASHVSCAEARRVVRAAIKTITDEPFESEGNMGFSEGNQGWFYYYHASGSDYPFRVHCVEADIGKGKVNFNAGPKE